MQTIYHSNTAGVTPVALADQEQSSHYGYKYPNNVDLRPGTDGHNRLLAYLMLRLRSSNQATLDKVGAWRVIDRSLKAYVTPETKKKIEKPTKMDDISIIYPYSFAVLDTMLSYLSVYFRKSPIFPMIANGTNDYVQAAIVELLLDKYINKNSLQLALMRMVRNNLAYGAGVGIPTWSFSADPAVSGCGLEVYSPYHLLPDPECTIEDVQTAEFFGFLEKDNYMNLLTAEVAGNGELFNVRYLRRIQHELPSIPQSRGFDVSAGAIQGLTQHIWKTPLYIKIIPREWNLGHSSDPELWFFNIANERVIIEARPANVNGLQFPIVTAADCADGQDLFPVSRLGQMQGMQVYLDWLLTSHLRQARLAINNRMIYDPDAVDGKVLASGKPFIPLKKGAMKRGIGDVVHQLRITDVTANHIKEVGVLVEHMQALSGIDASTMGEVRKNGPERMPSAEAEGTREGMLARINKVMYVHHLQAHRPLAVQWATYMSKYASEQMLLDIPPRYQQMFQGFAQARVRPMEVMGNPGQDYYLGDIVRPAINSPQQMYEALKFMMEAPVLGQFYNVPAILDRYLENLGVLDIADFRLQPEPEVQDDSTVTAEADKGNLVPLE